MSNALLPDFIGRAWPINRTPVWSTRIQKTASGRELRAAFYSYPIWKIELTFEVLRQTEVDQLVAFFNARRGAWDSFLWIDPNYNKVSQQPFGAGDGQATQFQLLRTIGGTAEPVFGLTQTPEIQIAGATQTSGYNINDQAVVTFATPPAAGAQLQWSGHYALRCRFEEDESQIEEFMRRLYALKKLNLRTVKP